jgi:hypothetical protein
MISIKKFYKKNQVKRQLLALLDSVVQCFAEICGVAICGSMIKICRFVICGLAYLRNLLICNSGISPRFCGFVICGLLKKFACPPLFILQCTLAGDPPTIFGAPSTPQVHLFTMAFKKNSHLRMNSTTQKLFNYKAYADNLTKKKKQKKQVL